MHQATLEKLFKFPLCIDSLESLNDDDQFLTDSSLNHNYVVVGMYHLIQNGENNIGKQIRIGALGMISLSESKLNDKLDDDSKDEFKSSILIDNLPYGILDMKLCPESNKYGEIKVVCATSDNSIAYFKLRQENFSDEIYCELIETTFIDKGTESSMALSVDYSLENSLSNKLGVGCSDGRCCIIGRENSVESLWTAHNAEVWTLTFSEDKIVTGSDDCIMRFWDCRNNLKNPILENKREHTSGVTSITFLPFIPGYFLSGSYDEYLRLWDIRKINIPIVKKKCSGGIWRIKTLKNYILLANCYGGGEIWEMKKPEDNLILKHSLKSDINLDEENVSLTYGISVLTRKRKEKKSNFLDNFYCLSSEFYMKYVNIWNI